MKLESKTCRCCGGDNFIRCGYRPLSDFFAYFGLHIKPAIRYRGEGRVRRLFGERVASWPVSVLNSFPGKALRLTNEIAYGACSDCHFISPWAELSDDLLHDYYSFYGADSYKRERSRFENGYRRIAAVHGSIEELVMRRKQHEEFIVPVLREHLNATGLRRLRLLDYGGGTGQVAPVQEWIDVDLYDVGDRRIRPLGGGCGKDRGEEAEGAGDSRVYDFIQLLHVLEHVGNPLEVIRSAMRHLNANGLFYVEVPWEMSDFEELSNPSSQKIVCDEHMNKFCDRSVAAMMRVSGFEPLRCEEGCLELLHADVPVRVVRCLAKRARGISPGPSNGAGGASR